MKGKDVATLARPRESHSSSQRFQIGVTQGEPQCLRGGSAEVSAAVASSRAQLVLDAQQAVVLGQALRAARSARLDLLGGEADSEVSDEGVLRLARAVASHDAPVAVNLSHQHSVNGLRHGADLVHLAAREEKGESMAICKGGDKRREKAE